MKLKLQLAYFARNFDVLILLNSANALLLPTKIVILDQLPFVLAWIGDITSLPFCRSRIFIAIRPTIEDSEFQFLRLA